MLLVTPAASPHQIARDVGPSDSINGMITMHSVNTTSFGHERHRRGGRATAGAPADVVGHAVQHGRHKRQRDGHPGRCTSPGRVGG